MLNTTLPFPDIGSKGNELRRMAARNISSLEIAGMSYVNGSHPGAAKLAAFFAACAAATTTIGKAMPSLTLSPQTSTGAGGSTQQLTLTKGGSSGTVTWVSSKPAVATVNAAGLVTRVAVGSVVITANVAEGASHKPSSLTATVTVA
jgi:uncharacterized protein YjdB